MKTIMALIPARGGSKRISKKNIRYFIGHPLIAHTIETAKMAGIFEGVYVSTDCQKTAEIARCYGANVIDRPKEFATETSPDFEWVNYTLDKLGAEGRMTDCAMLLRPTNPFRKQASLIRAWNLFREYPEADSMRAIRRAKEHPAKMWWKIEDSPYMMSYGYDWKDTIPKYERQTADLPEIYVQSAALEIFKSYVPLEHKNISGKKILPFQFPEYEDFDINTEADWILAVELFRKGLADLPKMEDRS